MTTTSPATLSAEQQRQAESHMKLVAECFENRDAEALEKLSHPNPSADQRGTKNSIDFNQGLMDDGFRVKSWNAKPFVEPDWNIMKFKKYAPPPTIWIDITLNNGERDYPIVAALAANESGALRTCYYVDR